VKVLQLNLNHCRSAQDLLLQTANEQDIDVAIRSEPYRPKPEVWQQSANGGAAIWSCGQPPGHLSQRASRSGYARSKFQATTIYSCYLAPSLPIEEFREIVQEIAENARGRSPVIIAGDFNAWHTFATAGAASIIDLMYVSSAIFHDARWSVSDVYTGSDHEAILCLCRSLLARDVCLSVGAPGGDTRSTRRPTKAYRPDTLRTQPFANALEGMSADAQGGANETANHIAAALEHACDQSMRQRGTCRRNQTPTFWWNNEIADLRSTCLHARRQMTRAPGSSRVVEYGEAYKSARKALIM
ncbi:hypothetical protein KR054_009146, partial [Drosophila jambulina]